MLDKLNPSLKCATRNVNEVIIILGSELSERTTESTKLQQDLYDTEEIGKK